MDMRRVTRGVLLLVLAASIVGPGAVEAVDPTEAVRVTELVRATASWDGTPIRYPEGTPAVTAMIVEIIPGGETGWHEHPVPSFGYVSSGAIEVMLEDGRTRRFEEGEVVVEVVGRRHNGRNPGTVPARLVLFYAGDAATPVTIRDPAQAGG